MVPEDRRSVLTQTAWSLAGLPEESVDRLLNGVDAPSTPPRWGYGLPAERRVAIMQIIIDLPAEALDRLALLASAIADRDSSQSSDAAATTIEPVRLVPAETGGPVNQKIFIVHGHDNAALQETARVLERATGLEVVILREQPNGGRTLIEKFEEHAGEAAYAVVLLTADDEGGVISSSVRQPRARQNVVFELGFFFGRLGRQNVAVLIANGVEQPSDVDGLAYIELDSAGAWRWTLGRELMRGGIDVDMKRIP